MARSPDVLPTPSSPLAVLRDVRVLRYTVQFVILALVVSLLVWLLGNAQVGLQRASIPTDFGFLSQPSGFQIDEGLTAQPHGREESYAHALWIGIVNTLRAVIVSLILSTLLGLIMGIARLSTNWLVRQIATWYIEIMQNTPLLLQLFFIFTSVLRTLPDARNAIVLPGPSYLSVKGLATPALVPNDQAGLWALIALIGLFVGIALWRRLRQIRIDTGQATYAAEIGLLVSGGTFVLSLIALNPFSVVTPRLTRFGYAIGEGAILSPEFVAIVAGLVLYTGAFIAEIVRSGIQSVSIGQWEASRSQGFTYFQTLRLVVLPQALRVMIPPLTNQYLNLAKNSSLGAAVGFAELFGVARTITQSVPAVPVIGVVMFSYLVMSLLTAAIMNVLNARFQIKVR